MSEQPLTDAMVAQYAGMWTMWREAIAACSDEMWRAGETQFSVPARLAFHVIQAADFYADADPNAYDWMAHGFDWEEAPAEALPAKEAVSAFLDITEKKVRDWLMAMGDVGLAVKIKALPWLSCGLAVAAYVLRHSQYHLGQLDTLLHRKGLPSPEWQ